MIPLGKALSDKHSVFAPDLPGFGSSSKPQRVLETAELGEVLARWMIESGLQDATIVANSYGCSVALEALKAQPSLTGPAVLMGATVDSHARNPIIQSLRMLQSLHREPWWFVPCALRDFVDCGLRASIKWICNMAKYDTIASLQRVTASIAIVRGEHDRVAPQRWIDALAESAGVKPVLISGAGHIAHGSKPYEVAAVVHRAAPAKEMPV